MASFADYTSGSGGSTVTSGVEAEAATGWGLERLKRSYTDYLTQKTDEINEQKDARRYRHASQWTADQVKIFNKRKQPIVTYNRIGRKIDGVIGLIEKLKQAPKAFPRTPHEEGGAALATAVVRSVLDENEWKTISYLVGQSSAIDGFGGVELTIEQGDEGDPVIKIGQLENDGFFYDPRSVALDFSDARYMGQGKWLDLDQAREMFPDKAGELEDAVESATDLSTNSDREQKWVSADGFQKRIRVVEEWYRYNGEWHWCIFTGDMKLMEGKSYFTDDKGKTLNKYVMFSAQVDQDGDRYGFVRNLKSAQDEINQRRSKALHLLNTRRIIAEQGAFDDLEVTRREATRPDGIVIRNKGFEAEFDDGAKNQEIQAHLEFLVDAKSEIENFGPNPALIGQGSLGDKSGRAISLLQQAGIAELGPFLLAYRGWKIRLYRAIWNAARSHWKAERFIRVTDDEKVLQWVGLNQVTVDPTTGMPAMQNHIAKLDVDIVMDEGPDSLTMGVETYEALLAIAQSGAQVPPAVLIELHPNLDPNTKQKILQQLQQPDPIQQLEQAKAQAEIEKMKADTQLSQAKAVDTMRGDQQGPGEHPMVTMAEVENKQADTAYKKAQAMATMQEAMLKPREQQHQEQMDHEQANQGRAKMVIDKQGKDADRMQNAYEKGADREQAAYEGERGREHETQQSQADPKLDLEREKMQLERERMQVEREEKAKDRQAKLQEKQMDREQAESDRDFQAESIGFKRSRTLNAERKAKQAEEVTSKAIQQIVAAVQQIGRKVDTLGEKVEDIAEDVNATPQIQRGKDGRIATITKGKRKMTVQRGKDGRVSGIS
jgi:hypothetical protein